MMYIGIDGGGTKTMFTLVDENDKQVDTYSTTTCHFAQVGFDGLQKVLKEGIAYLSQANNLKDFAIGYGLAGYGREIDIRKRIESVVKEVSEDHPYILVSDVQSALAGALDLQDGITMIAGTGSIALAKKGEEVTRCGGWGYLLGDEGSATWIGERVLQIFTKQADGRLKKGALYNLVMKKCDIKEDVDIISYVRENLIGKRSEIASFAILAYEAAMAKDDTMFALYEEAAKEISMMVNTLHKEFFQSCPTMLSYIGGVFSAKGYILEPLQSFLHTNIRLCAPRFGPDIGVIKLLKEKLEK